MEFRDQPTITLYTRATCEPCAEARAMLHDALEDRAAAGEPAPAMDVLDVDADADLRARYGALVPVLAVGASELPLVTSGRRIRAFLAATLPRRA